MPRLFFACLNVSNNPNSLYDASWQLEQADLLKRMKTDPTQPKNLQYFSEICWEIAKNPSNFRGTQTRSADTYKYVYSSCDHNILTDISGVLVWAASWNKIWERLSVVAWIWKVGEEEAARSDLEFGIWDLESWRQWGARRRGMGMDVFGRCWSGSHYEGGGSWYRGWLFVDIRWGWRGGQFCKIWNIQLLAKSIFWDNLKSSLLVNIL